MRAGVAVLLVACGHAAPAPAPVTPAPPVGERAELLCARYGYKVLVMEDHKTYDGPELVTAVDAAQAAAQGDASAAMDADAAGRPHDAALAFLRCAARFTGVPEHDPMVDTAIYDARVCYDNAIWAFANAGRLAAEGTAALEQAAGTDPRNAAYIRGQLATGWSECAK